MSDCHSIVPILNVRNVPISIAYYVDKLGFKKDWDWGSPPTFASVSLGKSSIYLCQGAQGQPGTWMSVFVDKAARISYVPMGDELGARRQEVDCYVNGKARYELIARTPLFREGLRRLQQGSKTQRVALMCAEKDPVTCHRAILVCRHLKTSGIAISHILPTGEIETHAQMEQRLLDVTADDSAALFVSDPVAVIDHAYDVQGDRIAYIQLAAAEERG
jgi:catechol 2,3-dioxygenase-like lactoylglutathione lyase family enzyme